ncbi:MAG: hypothetical protein NTV01_11745 [Bacteroidia bacterium]|nr:hypothetical protein [Bacteroidia bacterium]
MVGVAVMPTILTSCSNRKGANSRVAVAHIGVDERITPIGYIYKAFYSTKPMVKLLVKESDAEKLKIWVNNMITSAEAGIPCRVTGTGLDIRRWKSR